MTARSVRDYIEAAQAGDIDYADFAAKALAEAARKNKDFNLFVSMATELDFSPARLTGLPLTVKDCICVAGMQSAAGSRILEGYVPPFDATSVRRAKESGAAVLGKTQQDEFGFGTFSVNSGYAIPKNPLDPARSCGGSSGGAAAALAALDVPHLAMAESTGGSISCPAAFCGVVGLTPTYGLVSRYGLIDYANSLDKIGTMGKRVYDAALLLSLIAGHDRHDATSLNREQNDYTKHAQAVKLKGLRLAVPKEYFGNLEANVEKKVRHAIELLEQEGATCEEVSLPGTPFALASYYIIATSEASTNLSRFCGMRYGLHLPLHGNFNEYFSGVRSRGFGAEAKRRIMLGTFARMSGYRQAYYAKALQVRTLIIREFKALFKNYHAIAAPTMPIEPPKFSDIKKLSPSEHYQMDTLTVPANLAGLPHLSVPVRPKMPIGLHLIGDHLQEATLIEIAATYEGMQ